MEKAKQTTAQNKVLKLIMAILTAGGVLLLMLYMSGSLTGDKITPGKLEGKQKPDRAIPRSEQARLEKVTDYYEALGTVRPRTETTVEAQISARIEEVLVRPGQMVSRGDILVILDGREVRTRLERAQEGLSSATARREQAAQALASAKAVLNKADASFRRIKTYFQAEAATRQDLESAEAAYLQAQASVRQSEDALREAESGIKKAEKLIEEAKIWLTYTRITAHASGQIAKRLAEPGDLAVPGRPLLILHTGRSLRLEALVRESHLYRVAPGSRLRALIDAIGFSFETSIDELIPSGDPLTRTFVVKAVIPSDERIFPGMFGRILIPLEEREIVTVPKAAVRRVGQLETVLVKAETGWLTVLIKTGKDLGERVEVLSGLSGKEIIAVEG